MERTKGRQDPKYLFLRLVSQIEGLPVDRVWFFEIGILPSSSAALLFPEGATALQP
jgi:hypothetical protein